MPPSFSDIPNAVIDYVRHVFSNANDKVSRTITTHPSMYEETLDHILVMELSASPPAFFAAHQIGLSIESHWLGARWMYQHWEIADIAFFVLIRSRGHLVVRKVALLQTKRLYSKEIAVTELHEDDYRVGIGRLVDRTDRSLPIATQRKFSFDTNCVYGALRGGDEQVDRIGRYIDTRGIAVYYGLYNPLILPARHAYPELNGQVPSEPNHVGCRVIPFTEVKGALARIASGTAASFTNVLLDAPIDPADRSSTCGWRLERFIADEVLRCRQGHIFDDRDDPNLRALLYERGAPITAAISITIDFGRAD